MRHLPTPPTFECHGVQRKAAPARLQFHAGDWWLVWEGVARRAASQSWRCTGSAGLRAAVVAGGAAPAPDVVGQGGRVAHEKQPQQHRQECDAGRHIPV
jgi:hypothetical protein